jgi:hypothetical protein
MTTRTVRNPARRFPECLPEDGATPAALEIEMAVVGPDNSPIAGRAANRAGHEHET